MATPALMITTGSNEAGRLSAGDSGSVGGVRQPGRDPGARCQGCGVGGRSLEPSSGQTIPALTGDARTFLGESEPDQRCTEPEKNRANPWRVSTRVLERESPKIAQITDQISDLAKHADSVVGSVEPVVKHLDQAVANVDSTVSAIREPLTKDLAELENTLQAAQSVLADVQNLVGSNEATIGETVRNLRSASENVRALTESVKQRPWSLVRTKQPADRRVPQ